MSDQDALLVMANLLVALYNRADRLLSWELEELIDERLDVIRKYATEPIKEGESDDTRRDQQASS